VPLEESREAMWFEFNDTNVIPFSADRIPYECFGGEEEVMVYDRDKGTAKKVMRPKINNAYILVYERKDIDLDDWGKLAVLSPLPIKSVMRVVMRSDTEPADLLRVVSLASLQRSSSARRRSGRRASDVTRQSRWRRRIPPTRRPIRRATTKPVLWRRTVETTQRTHAQSPS
jgi:hypothetical protein